MAQKLNNNAATFIENGRYEKAIEYLAISLKSSQQGKQEKETLPDASVMDYCIKFSRVCRRKFHGCKAAEEENEGYIYCEPIRISPEYKKRRLRMNMLAMIITYNLALSHHLIAMRIEGTKERKKMLHKSQRLYELVYRWQIEENVDSLGFNMIIANNLGQIHRASKNQRKHKICMQHLLSTIMYALVNKDEEELELVEMEGFLQNTSPFIFQDHCAGAA
jgi:hypothetical protein